MILAAEKDREHANDAPLIINGEIEDCAVLGDTPQARQHSGPQRALMWRLAQCAHFILHALDAHSRAGEGALEVIAKMQMALEEKIEDGVEVARHRSPARDAIGLATSQDIAPACP